MTEQPEGDVVSTGVAAPSASRVTWRQVFAVREYRGVFAANLVSLAGDQVAKIAIALLVFDRTHNALLGATTYAVTMLPALIGGAALGFLADTRPRRGLMITCDLVRAALVAVMLLPGMPIWGYLLLLVGVATLDVPFSAARAATVVDALPAELYPLGQSLVGVMQQVAQIVGFAGGGVLFAALDARGSLLVDIGTFLVSAVLVRLCVRARPAPAAGHQDSRWELVSGGARAVLGRPLLRGLIGTSAASFVGAMGAEGLAVAYARQIGHGDVAAGLLTAALPVGAALGTLVFSRVPAAARMRVFRTLALVWPAPLLLTALRPPVAVTIVLWAVAGLLVGFHMIGFILFSQALTDRIRGRAFAFVQTLFAATQGVGLLLAGLAGQLTTPAFGVAILAAAGLAVCVPLVVGLRAPSPASSHPGDDRYDDVAAGPSVRAAQAAASIPAAREPSDEAVPHGEVASRGPATRSMIVLAVLLVTGGCLGVALAGWSRVAAAPLDAAPWVLLPAFVATAYFRVHIERGRSSMSVSVTQIVTLLALYFAEPTVLYSCYVAAILVLHAASRSSLTRVAANVAIASVEAVSALAVFHAFAVAGPRISGPHLLVGLLAVVASDTAGAVFAVLFRRLFLPTASTVAFLPSVLLGLGAGVVASLAGLLAVAAIFANASSAVLLVVLALLMAVGFRGVAKLQERHASLGRLYSFQEKLGALVPQGPSLFPVLEHARELLQAEDLTLRLDGTDSAQVHALRVHADAPPWEGYEAGTNESGGICVELRVDDRVLGVLSSRRRLGHVRGFDAADLRLLETLAAHVSDALERGTLLTQLQDAATHDSLTGLLTLGELMARVDERLLRDGHLTLALVDVSGLRDVNDSLGYAAGDALLRTLGERLSGAFPVGTLIARSGGGEFAVAVDSDGALDGLSLTETLADVGNGLVRILGVTVELRTRVGWLVLPADAADASTAVRRADLALAAAKRGSNPVARFLPAMNVDGARRLRLVQDLRTAIADGTLNVVYQPLASARTGEVVGAEALVRWEHPELGALSPDEFVAIAEHSGLINDMTRYVLDQALAQVRAWHLAGRDVRIAVNLSARCLTDMSLPGTVLDLLAHHRVGPQHLTLEVTETSVAEEPVRALAVLDRLRGIGVRLSIDDFGTGYSSLAALKRFPVQEVKLDRQFLLDAEASEDGGDWALLAAIINLGHALDLEIVAEGVESEAAFARLRGLGVDVVQGYFIGRPAPGTVLRADAVDVPA